LAVKSDRLSLYGTPEPFPTFVMCSVNVNGRLFLVNNMTVEDVQVINRTIICPTIHTAYRKYHVCSIWRYYLAQSQGSWKHHPSLCMTRHVCRYLLTTRRCSVYYMLLWWWLNVL